MDSESAQNVGEVERAEANGIIEGQDANRNIEGGVKVKMEAGEMDGELNDESPEECNEMIAMNSEDTDFLGKAEDLIPPSPGGAEWTDYECTSADDMLDAARIFDCVNLPNLSELQYNLEPPAPLPPAAAAAPASSSLGSSTSSSSASVSSPSSSSWLNTSNMKSEEAMERHYHSSSTPSIDQDSATSTSYQNFMVIPFEQPADSHNNNICKEYSYSDLDHADKIDVLEELQNLDLLDGSDMWDPFSAGALDGFVPADNNIPSEELPMVFFEWLKSNKDSISPEDLRSIKLKRSTIELAAKQLGGGKKAMLHLLKLILAWVQNNHLQRKRKLSQQHQKFNGCRPSYFVDQYNQCYNGGGVMDHGFEPQSCYAQVAIPTDPSMFAALNNNTFNPPPAPSMDTIHHPAKYRRVPLEGCGGFTSSHECQPMFQPLDGGAPWPNMNCMLQNQLPYENYRFPPPTSQSQVDYMNYRSSTPAVSTKEARKNRMARQRRSMAHHHHHHHQNRHWSASTSPLSRQSSEQVNINLMQYQQQRQTYLQTDRRQINVGMQGWKPEKNLKFLLQKVLKQSDVGNLGRIVLPKKEAETHLPELEARDGISIAMEDIVTSHVWNMRYRFWPNNKSRMYLLENTGDFVRSNGLQEGDFIVLYSDTKTGKYMIRGVKVPRSDTSASAPAATKCTNGSSSLPDGGDAKQFLKMGKSYLASTSQSVAVTFADSVADASSSSVSDATVHSCPEADPFLRDMVTHSFPTKGTSNSQHDHPGSASTNLESLSSLESGDLTIEEILDLVDSPDLVAEPAKSDSSDDIAESKD
ncbi:B3 domain-containing transcription factor ABI3 isoform X1 [Cryptomeria japonica]|uniref:B3 domain-containing transcription factor ABI3 isoform X1 n=1 Tax=Cryptomeria japonica TaxID=3369 RepID=UPI0027DA3376|nr:B3 domain-containing transcription factor ABI3 isoform X1 [Cryptomeria japonica]